MEDEFLAIVSEDLNWFDHQITFAMPNVFATKTEALENIVAACAEGLSDHPANDDFFVLSLEKAKRALRKATREAPDVKNMTTEYQRELAALAASKREENPR